MSPDASCVFQPQESPHLSHDASLTRPPRRETISLCVTAFLSSCLLAFILVFRDHIVLDDAISRVMNAYYVYFRGHFHFGAIGFVWNPFPSLLELPISAFHSLWPPLVTVGFAANLASSMFAAVSVYYMDRILFHLGLARLPRIILCIAFMFNPMIWYYAANGMSDGMLMGCLLGATDGVLSYLKSNRLESLAMGAIWLAVAFMFRYESIPFFIVTGCAMAISLRRMRRPAQETEAMFVLYATPTVYAVAAWIFLNWLIMKNPLYFLNSPYGNATQVGTGSYVTITLDAAKHHLFQSLLLAGRFSLLFWPCILGIIYAVIQQFRIKPDPRWLALLSASISVPLFQAGMMYMGISAGWARFFIYYIPFGFLLIGFILATSDTKVRSKRLAVAGMIVLVLLGDIGTFQAMKSPVLGNGDSDVLSAIEAGRPYRNFQQENTVSQYINDHTGLIVLTDTFDTHEIVARMKHPSQCVITSDVDFNSVLQNPRGRVNAFLVPKPQGLSALDALNRTYPGLWAGKVQWAKLITEFPGNEHFRLYEITKEAP